MKICVDARPYFFRSGVGTYTRRALAGLLALDPENDYVFLISSQQKAEDFPLAAPRLHVRVSRAEWECPDAAALFAQEADNLGADVCYMPFLLKPIRIATPLAITLHDIIPCLHPEYFPPELTKQFSASAIKAALDAARRILTDSECTKRDAGRALGIPAEKMIVAPCGVSSAFRPHTREETAPVLAKYQLSFQEYIFNLGVVEPRKNILGLLRAYKNNAARRARRMPLVVAGKKGWNVDDVYEYANSEELRGNVRFLDFVPDADLPALLAGAALFVYPSLYEGFGLPVLEAMASGVPVVTTRAASIPEITGEHGAALVPPGDITALRDAMDTVLSDDTPRTTLRGNAVERAKNFSWTKTAQGILRALREIVVE